MLKRNVFWSAAVVVSGLALASASQPARAQVKKVQPERQLLGIRLGADMLQLLRRFGQPNEVQTVRMEGPTDTLPGLGGAAGGAAMASGGVGGSPYAGMMGGMMGGMSGSPYGGMGGGGMAMGPPGRGGAMSGGAMSGGGMAMGPPGRGGASGVPNLPPVGGGPPAGTPYAQMMGGAGLARGGGMSGSPYGGMGGGAMGDPGMMGSPGMMSGPGGAGGIGGGLGAANANMPEYSTALLFIYRRPNNVRLEFLVNEDSKIAQISVAVPAEKAGAGYPGAKTSRGIGLGSTYRQTLLTYGMPERTRMLPGLRFMEAYYTRDYHAAFTFDTTRGMKVVRITIALAD